ncbi:hypothetical protein A2594_02635 [Candidatus Woesebacteria bacterium RIFOXYD1_FULL_41_28]|uniref:Uncharacterized protein n=1 Tax=Candidatus Woesebacteria bacterium RIFOXYD1_FULL_41_28 TaxID=1802550 RepID=A0A1F8DI35_9BACT|nr:MAG: hypothetical protein A2594_02635 [Candidatus Woesebacteria bacterium RIFOXYD1_FULL_41_28]
MLTGFSTLLLTIIAGTFGFSLLKQSELKKEAEKDVRKINNFASKVTKLHNTVQKNVELTTNYVKAAEKLVNQVAEKTSKLDPLIEKVEKKGKEAAESVSEIRQIREEIERANESLGTLSASGPTVYSGPLTAGSLSDYLGGGGGGANVESAQGTINDYLSGRKNR